MAFRDIQVFAHMIGAQYDNNPDKHILTFVSEHDDIEETRTYGELYENAHKLAEHILSKGMKPGDRFGLLLKNHPEFVEGLIAASITGCLAVPIDPRTKGDKLIYMLKDSNCKGLICADYNAAEVNKVIAEAPVEWRLLVGENTPEGQDLDGFINYQSVSNAEYHEQTIVCTSGEDPMQVLYTSGTTGDPKGIVKANSQFVKVAMAIPMLLKLKKTDCLYTGLSLSHGNAQFFTLAVSLGAGIPSVYSRTFTKSRFWDTIRHYNCSVFTLLGGMSTAIYSEAVKENDADNPVRMVISAGMPQVIWEAFKIRFGTEIVEVYGAAEGGLFWNDGSGPVGSFGHLTNNALYGGRVVDDSDENCAPGMPGELIWQTKDSVPVVVEYLNKPEASAKKTRDGWFRTGDVVHQDENGWLFFDYRKGGGIRRNGDFINPNFVEKAIAEHDSIDDVFVYGVPIINGTPGEKDVVAAIVAAENTDFDAKAIFASCREKLESNFVPRFLQVVAEIPKTSSEKPQERFLIDAFALDAENVFIEDKG